MNQVWASSIGVVLCGGISYPAQLTTASQAARTEDKRQAVQLAEARRAERLEVLREFIQLTQQGAYASPRNSTRRPSGPPAAHLSGSPPNGPSSSASGSASG
ncbi:hypothetical protein AB0I51_44350 [Streptomyces sp. NPDC050549]|uniref:hypothetical protein n=1 Tax=Streptomyces sp. NPDC050549 TaxID=3155406 RepID=UPI003422A3D4